MVWMPRFESLRDLTRAWRIHTVSGGTLLIMKSSSPATEIQQ